MKTLSSVFTKFSRWDKNIMLGYIEGGISLLMNTLLFGLKYWVGLQTGSVAILADAWHTLSDSLTSLVVILGFKISSAPPDRKHPFGHGRAEVISSIIIGTLLAIVGFEFLQESLHRFIRHQTASFNKFAVIIFIVSVLLKEGIAQFSFWCGRKINARSLIADGWHHRSDAIASALILFGMYIGSYFWWIDSIMGIIVAFLIFYTTYDIMRDSISSLLGETPPSEFKTKLYQLVTEHVPPNIQLHHLHVHEYGNHKELTFHIRLPHNMLLQDTHHITDILENAIRNDMDIEATIHVEPLMAGAENSD